MSQTTGLHENVFQSFVGGLMDTVEDIIRPKKHYFMIDDSS